MTEDEAKKKWCPFALGALFMRGDSDASVCVTQGSNRIVSDVPEISSSIQACIEQTLLTRCLGSKCMAWRWVQRVTNQADLDNSFMWSVGGKRPIPQFEDTDHGFCGLAGKP